MQVEMIKWLAYPENIPNKDRKHYIATIKHPDKGYSTMELFWVGNEFKDFDDWVTAYAHRPKPCDPTAKQFNFWTALEMMKSGVVCISLYYGFRYRIRSSDQITYTQRWDTENKMWIPYKFDVSEIEGLWEVAE